MSENTTAATAAATDTIEVGGKTVRVKFPKVHFPELNKTYTREELLADAEAVAELLEIKSGAVEIVESVIEKEAE